MQLDAPAAERAMQRHVATPLGLSVTQAANGILRIAATKMSYQSAEKLGNRGIGLARLVDRFGYFGCD